MTITPSEQKAMLAYLNDNNYDTIEDWAMDSDYRKSDNGLFWLNEEGHITDLWHSLFFAMEACGDLDKYMEKI